MTMQDGITHYNLKKPLSYQFGGQTVRAQFLELREPGMEHSSHYFKLRQMVTRACVEITAMFEAWDLDSGRSSVVAGGEVKKTHEQDEAGHADETEEAIEMISMALHMAEKVDLDQFLKIFAEMACNEGGKSICAVDGRVAMTKGIWANMSLDDALGAAVRWSAFFAMPDVLGSSIFEKQSGSH